MKNIASGFCFIILCIAANSSIGQKLKTEQIAYSYNRLPALPVKGISNYLVTIDPVFEAKNQQAMKDYQQQEQAAEDQFRKDEAAYPGLVKAANDRYSKEMEAYDKKSLGTKIAESATLNNGKPVREIIPRPYLKVVDKPELQTSYDYKVLGDTYIHIDGYQNDAANALKIIVMLYGYDHTLPRTIDEQDNTLSLGGGSASAQKVTYYHTEFSYRYPMAIKVYTPDGKEILSVTPPELNSYKIFKGPAGDRPTKINTDLLLKTTQENILQDNFRFINNMLNDKYGFSSVKKIATLYYIKNGDTDYPDLTTAFNEASSGLLMLQQDNNTAKAKLQKSCDLWNTALKEADISNKKARINKEIATGILFNLLEGYFALGDATGGEASLEKLNGMSLSNTDRRAKLDFDVLFAELKNRQQHN